jgi:hypothetical protein
MSSMSRIVSTIVGTFLLVLASRLPASASESPRLPTTLQGKVIAIADGDTLTVLVDRTQPSRSG